MIHTFDSTGEAYDACQCDENIHDGDVLVIEAEQVVGVADTWPVAVTKEYGSLHALSPDATPEKWASEAGNPALLSGWQEACKKAVELGYPLDR